MHRPWAFLSIAATALTLSLAAGACSSGADDHVPTGPTVGSGGEGAGAATSSSGGGMGGSGPFDGVDSKPVIYQLVVRLFGNTNETRTKDGTLAENGSGKFADVNEAALAAIHDMGVTHVWLTGVLRQATLTDYSSLGMPADDADAVKGRAGSFYAVRDYYDVSPDYAVDPNARLAELDALVARIHAAGMKVMIDLVPNHVARGYGSIVKPETDFGASDDQTKFFSAQNDFFYLADPPGQSLTLTKPESWNPVGVVFDGQFAPENGSAGNVPKATGNNVTAPAPSVNDWYETIKLNYGFDFVDGSSSFDPMPSSWPKVDAILAYWQGHGVDGFRCDFAHYVPTQAWSYLLGNAKTRDPNALFIAEAYDNLDGLLASGFDAVYHDTTYDTLKLLYLGKKSQGDLDTVLGSLNDAIRGHYVEYLENHDERRLASPIVPGDDPGSTGFGSPNAGHQLAPLVYLYSNGPVIFYNGQEVGEPGAGEEGFGGNDGRTSIFDYWSMPEHVKWVNGHAYDGGLLSADQKALRSYYSDLLALAQKASVRGNRYWGLKYFNNAASFSDASDAVFSFARFAEQSNEVLLVAANLGTGGAATTKLRIPDDLAVKAGFDDASSYVVRVVLDETGAKDEAVTTMGKAALASDGFTVTIADQSATVISITPVP